MLLQGNQGQGTKQVGQNITAGFGEYSEMLVTELQPRYYENTYRGKKFSNLFASNALAAAGTSAIDVLINPAGSGVNLVLMDAYTAFTALTAVATGTLCAIGWFAAAVIPGTIGTLQVPNNMLVGSTQKSNAICAPTATIGVAASYVRTLASLYGDLAANDIVGQHDDIGGAVIVPPGFGLAVYGVTGTVTDVTVQVSLTWDEIPV
jgi:hypothetical protein